MEIESNESSKLVWEIFYEYKCFNFEINIKIYSCVIRWHDSDSRGTQWKIYPRQTVEKSEVYTLQRHFIFASKMPDMNNYLISHSPLRYSDAYTCAVFQCYALLLYPYSVQQYHTYGKLVAQKVWWDIYALYMYI